MREKERVERIYKAIFVIEGLSDKEVSGQRREGVEQDIKKAIKVIFEESGMKRVRVRGIRVPGYERRR